MYTKKFTFHYCSHSYPLGEAGAAEGTNTSNPDFMDGSPAAMLAKYKEISTRLSSVHIQ